MNDGLREKYLQKLFEIHLQIRDSLPASDYYFGLKSRGSRYIPLLGYDRKNPLLALKGAVFDLDGVFEAKGQQQPVVSYFLNLSKLNAGVNRNFPYIANCLRDIASGEHIEENIGKISTTLKLSDLKKYQHIEAARRAAYRLEFVPEIVDTFLALRNQYGYRIAINTASPDFLAKFIHRRLDGISRVYASKFYFDGQEFNGRIDLNLLDSKSRNTDNFLYDTTKSARRCNVAISDDSIDIPMVTSNVNLAVWVRNEPVGIPNKLSVVCPEAREKFSNLLYPILWHERAVFASHYIKPRAERAIIQSVKTIKGLKEEISKSDEFISACKELQESVGKLFPNTIVDLYRLTNDIRYADNPEAKLKLMLHTFEELKGKSSVPHFHATDQQLDELSSLIDQLESIP